MSYSVGQMVRIKASKEYGEVLRHHGNGRYDVRVAVYGDPDRSFKFFMLTYDQMEPIDFAESEACLFNHARPEWHVPLDIRRL